MTLRKIKPSAKQKFYQAFKFFYRMTGKANEMDSYFRVEKFSRVIHPLHFSQTGASQTEKETLFKKTLMGVEFETHAYCNRTCSFCPNSFLDRRNKAQLMDEKVFYKILDNLAAIDFAGEVKMQRYNEPLAHEIIYERVAQTRKALPKARLSFHSNGDYVTLERLARLEKAGLDEVFVSLYLDYEKDKDNLVAAGQELCHNFLKRVGVQDAVPIESKTTLGRYMFYVGKLKITAFTFNLYESGNDRGGSLKDLSIDSRQSPCESPFLRLYIDWTGDVFPCCNLRADYPEHKNYSLGNVKKDSLMDIFYSKTANFMRKELALVGEKTGVCRSCKFDLMCSNKAAKKVLDKTVAGFGVAS